MSESHATTSVFLSCAAARRPAASAAAPTPAVTRKSRRLTPDPMCASSVRNLFGPEKDVLRSLQVVPVELTHQLLARGRRDVPLILVHVADLDPLDVAPARRLGAVDGPFDAMGAIAHDAGQRSRHHVVVLPQPALVVLALDARLQCRDHVPYRHGPFSPRRLPAPPARGSKQSSTSPGASTASRSATAWLRATTHVSWSAPSPARTSPIVAPAWRSRVVRLAPSGRKRRSVPCITTVTVTASPPSPAA